MNVDKLINKILLSSNEELIVFIEKNFTFEKMDDFSDIKKKEEMLFKLEIDVIRHCLFRLESLEEIYDTSKGASSGFNLIGVICGFILKDYIAIFINPKDHQILYFFGQVIMFGMISYMLVKILKKMNKTSKDKSKIIYFKRLLEYILNEKEK
ncbi:hypothetical protein [Bacillus multifaciens]|uniref:hypothetical protein n=1 Tax=Bacillus multifaciens TaxID=3068506 RepID=UPI002740E532|nr:hypothetical protein [Bacillus sp. WLY-B-L8]MDP7979917.1 hypothetical protein [Bacillus sp. WLY-B-L8]